MALSLDAPIEDLGLSNRVRNVLHLSGLHTVASLFECDYKAALRGFGPGARAELASALESDGFTPPASLNPSEIDDIAGDISKLFGQMEASFRKWSARSEHFEMRIRELTAKGSDHQRRAQPAAEAADQSRAIAGAALALEFRRRLGAICAAIAALREVARLPPEQQKMVELVEDESVQLRLLVGRLVEMMPAENKRVVTPEPRRRAIRPASPRFENRLEEARPHV